MADLRIGDGSGSILPSGRRTAREDSSMAWRRLDYVFASASIAGSVTVQALNGPAQWGPSDHCRLVIEAPL